MFKAPKIEMFIKRAYEIPFSALVAATSQQTIVSGLISFKFRVTLVKMIFDTDHVNSVLYYWLIGRNNQGSTTGLPEGDNIFREIVPVNFFVGNGETRTLQPNVAWEEDKGYLKLHINNLNTYAVTVKATIGIQEL